MDFDKLFVKEEETKPRNPKTLPFKRRIRDKNINPVVEETFSSVYKEWHGSPYTFMLNYETFVVFFDDVTPTRLPKEVMEYFKNEKLPKMNQTRNPLGKEQKVTYMDW